MDSSGLLNLILKSLPLLLNGLIITVQVGVISSLIGIVGGTLFGLLNSRRLKSRWLSLIINFYVLIIRGTPLYVQVLIIYFALPDILGINLSPFVAGILALSCNSIAYVSEIIRSGVNSIPSGQWEAAYVLGFNFIDTMRYVILPQMFKNVLPALTSEFVVLLKDTSILSVIGLVEMTRIGNNIIARTLQPMPIYLMLAFLYLILTTTITLLTNKIEKRLFYGDR